MNRALKLVLGLALIVTGMVIIFSRNQFSRSSQTPVSPSLTPTSTYVPITTTPIVRKAVKIPVGWKKFSDSSKSFGFSYDPRFEARAAEKNTVNLFLKGPSQTEGTEVQDGILFNVTRRTSESGSIETAAKLDIQKESEHGEVTESLKEVAYSGKAGLQYSFRGLGEFTHIYLPLTKTEFLHISYLLEDPKNQGFKQVVDTMLESFEFK